MGEGAIGWLGDAYLWVKAAHVVFVIFWMAGLFMLPRFFVYHMSAAPGSPEDALWIERERRLMRIIVNPAMMVVWTLGLALAFHLGFAGQGWLHAKLAVVLALTGWHHWFARLRKAFARGERPVPERTLRIQNEIPSVAAIVIVILVIVKPF